MAGHISVSGPAGVGSIAWGPGLGASYISGGPYHFNLRFLDGNTLGSQDNQFKGADALTPVSIATTSNPTGNTTPGVLATDTATVTSNNGTPTGSVLFFLCGPDPSVGGTVSAGGCVGGTQIGGAVALNGSGIATSAATLSTQTDTLGTYCWRVEYTGTGSFVSNTHTNGTTECFTTQQVTPTVVTTLHRADHTTVANGGSVTLGTNMHDSAAVSGSAGTATGTVTFTFYTGGNCATGTPAGAGTVALVAGVAHPSSASGALTPGSYAYQATYNGNANYTSATSDCEPFSVAKADTTTATTLHKADHSVVANGDSVTLGTNMHDSATVRENPANAAFDPTGNVTFTFYTGGNCATGTPAGAGTVALVASGVAHPSNASGALTPGSYAYQATYTGDGNFNGSTSACEPFSVAKADTTTATTLHQADHSVVANGDSVTLGTNMHDSAQVSENPANAAFDPTGNVTFTFYTGGNCATGTPAGAGTVALDASGVAHPSNASGALTPGSYAYQATYTGDGNFNGSTSACEPFSVAKADTTTATTLHQADHSIVANGSTVPLGTNMHDSAQVSENPANAAFDPTGNVTFTFYTGGNCATGTPAGAGTVALVAGVAHPSSASGALTPGSYAYQATYNGDGNFNGSTSACEPFSVAKADTTTATTLHQADHSIVDNGDR